MSIPKYIVKLNKGIKLFDGTLIKHGETFETYEDLSFLGSRVKLVEPEEEEESYLIEEDLEEDDDA